MNVCDAPEGDPFRVNVMAAVELPKSYATKLIKERVIWFKSSHDDFAPGISLR